MCDKNKLSSPSRFRVRSKTVTEHQCTEETVSPSLLLLEELPVVWEEGDVALGAGAVLGVGAGDAGAALLPGGAGDPVGAGRAGDARLPGWARRGVQTVVPVLARLPGGTCEGSG